MDELISILHQRKLKISAMESCTGGLLMSEITNHPNASQLTEGGAVTYSDEQKIRHKVPADTIATHTVYSEACAVAMGLAIRGLFGCDIGIGITGQMSAMANVYYSVVFREVEFKRILIVPESLASRLEQKRYVVRNVVEDIVRILKAQV